MQRGAGHLYQAVDRHRIRVRRQVGKRQQQADAVVAGFAHADDAAAAGLQPGVAHVFQRVQAVLVLAGMDDGVVVIRRGVQIVVVVVQPGFLERLRLVAFEHAQGGAGFQAQCLHFLDHRRHLGDVAVLGRTPRRAHAEARGAGLLGRAGAGDHAVGVHQLLRVHAGVIALSLRAVGTVFRATAGLDREQGGDLDFCRIEMLPVCAGSAVQQFGEGQIEQGLQLFAFPVVADDGGHRCYLTVGTTEAAQSGEHG
ncbi:hypothetical protein D3C81_1045580 [compost metagenome]